MLLITIGYILYYTLTQKPKIWTVPFAKFSLKGQFHQIPRGMWAFGAYIFFNFAMSSPGGLSPDIEKKMESPKKFPKLSWNVFTREPFF